MIFGVGEYGASTAPGEELRTLALGSCVAVAIIDRATGAVGMAHIVFPDSSVSADRAAEHPGYFADTAIPVLINTMEKLGRAAKGRNWRVKIAGGANVTDPMNTFSLGHRNVVAVRKALSKYDLEAVAEDVGGSFNRSVGIRVGAEVLTLTSCGRGSWEI